MATCEEGTRWRDVSSLEKARLAIQGWIHWYNEERPHRSLGHPSPAQHRAQHIELGAFQGEPYKMEETTVFDLLFAPPPQELEARERKERLHPAPM